MQAHIQVLLLFKLDEFSNLLITPHQVFPYMGHRPIFVPKFLCSLAHWAFLSRGPKPLCFSRCAGACCCFRCMNTLHLGFLFLWTPMLAYCCHFYMWMREMSLHATSPCVYKWGPLHSLVQTAPVISGKFLVFSPPPGFHLAISVYKIYI